MITAEQAASVRNVILQGDTLARLKELPTESVDMVITSPPYWGLRNYGTAGVVWGGSPDCAHDFSLAGEKRIDNHNGHGITAITSDRVHRTVGKRLQVNPSHTCTKCGAWRGELGLEPTSDLYLDHLIAIFAEVKRVLKPTGTCWVNLGDTYNSSKKGNTNGTYGSVKQKAGINDMAIDKQRQHGLPAKTLCFIPSRFAQRMVDELGFSCRNDIIWHKPNSMPQSVKDRFAVDYEHLYFFVKSPRYHFDTQYEPLSPVTLKELERAYTGQAKKDYASAGAQNPSDVKRRILKGFAASMGGGGTGLKGHNCQLKADGTPIVKGAFDTFDQAKALGWQPEVESYGEWYFNTRQKKGWHDHAADAEQGNGQQKRGHAQPKLEHPLGRVKRSVWRISVRPFKGAHFAVFPEALIETPILAGCPEFICSKCGKPAKTTYTETRHATRPGNDVGNGKSGTDADPNKILHNSDLSKYRQTIVRTSKGLKAGCTHEGAEVLPGIVLDPFMGAGTTALVARRLGRDYLGIELKQEYVDMAVKRLG